MRRDYNVIELMIAVQNLGARISQFQTNKHREQCA